jgi:hypothetical protein
MNYYSYPKEVISDFDLLRQHTQFRMEYTPCLYLYELKSEHNTQSSQQLGHSVARTIWSMLVCFCAASARNLPN